MLYNPLFWVEDVNSTSTRLFERNQNFITKENAMDKVNEAKIWLENLSKSYKLDIVKHMIPKVEDEAIQHIFEMDAVRTFASAWARERHKTTLSTIYQFTQDYHQGLGFVVAWLLLFFEPEIVVGIVRVFHEGPMNGYFKKEAATLYRDAKVVERMMSRKFPEVYQHLESNGISAGTYSSKWLVALNLHCLPFACLFQFYTDLFKNSDNITKYLFGYSLSVIDGHKSHIMATNQVDKILEHLRNDLKVHPDETSLDFYTKMVEDAQKWMKEITDDEIAEDRRLAQLELDEMAEKRQAFLDANESSDGITFSDEDD